ncbi:hypothetical protein ApDm4_2254 [Acetobacter pomorum]|nr:hypothetical protein ApDm4_2254 [Acetobacter pomorum]
MKTLMTMTLYVMILSWVWYRDVCQEAGPTVRHWQENPR